MNEENAGTDGSAVMTGQDGSAPPLQAEIQTAHAALKVQCWPHRFSTSTLWTLTLIHVISYRPLFCSLAFSVAFSEMFEHLACKTMLRNRPAI